MLSNRFNRWTVAAIALMGSAMATVPGAVRAQTPDHPSDTAAQFPTRNDLKALTTSGSYLAARHASVERDAASAAAFYRSALRTDPKNNELLDRAFISSVADGDIDEAVKLAERILTIDKTNRVARLVVGVHDLKFKKYATAQTNINQSIRGPITDLVATLLSGWAAYGAGDAKGGVATIDKLAGPEWYPLFKDLHAGMILELGRQGERRWHPVRACLQARRFHVACHRGLCALAISQQGLGRRDHGLPGFRQEARPPSADRGRVARHQGRQEDAAAGR
ncbi:tetratricopeptide (TPR) repeat protein [Bradyrhizobium sp. GM0.4]